ncbi:MAG: hypothetical protein B7Z55_02550 [Planctomycetales bacterium 12-60-4]|nr:MAG: hypothetical protein B7Z55_02550 [Planctomycetales bacterium 12-60-4]
MRSIRIVAGALIVVGLVTALVYSQLRPERLHVSGFIEAHDVRVGSRVGGRIAEVLIDEGQVVQRDQPLVKLDPFDLLQRRAEAAAVAQQRQEVHAKLKSGFRQEEIAAAKANVDQMQAVLDKLVAGPRPQEIAAATARLALAKAELERAQLQFQRVESLFGKGVATQDQFDEAEKQAKVTRAQVSVAEDELALLKEGSRVEDIAAARGTVAGAKAELDLKSNGYRQEEIAEAAAAVDAAQATLAAIERQMEELTIAAPLDGVVEAIDLRPGDLVSANAPAVSMIDTSELWVRAYVPENHLNLQIGQSLSVTVDSFAHREFAGRISFIARQAEFTPGNVQTPEDRSKQVFRIKVIMTDGRDVLRPGMAADVWLDGLKK